MYTFDRRSLGFGNEIEEQPITLFPSQRYSSPAASRFSSDTALSTYAELEGLGTNGFWTRLIEKISSSLAGGILGNSNVTLATAHVSGVNDNATARQQVEDTSNGSLASRSSYGNAPGGTVKLDIKLLAGILSLADTYTFSISELAGGSHSKSSRHYDGVTVDVNVINGRQVSATHPDVANFKRDCRSMGATEVLGG
jgi:hypothetical protein